MTRSLHISLPDGMRAFVDRRTDGRDDFSTPSEYVRSLIRADMKKAAEKLEAYRLLLQGNAEINARDFVSKQDLENLLKEFD